MQPSLKRRYRCLDPKPRLHTGVWSPNRGYTQVFRVPNRGYTRVFGVPNGRSCKLPWCNSHIAYPAQQRSGGVPLGLSFLRIIVLSQHCRHMSFPNGATHRCFGYAQASGSPTAATYRCLSMPRRLDPQLGLRKGVWIPNRGYTRVFGVPNGRSCKLPVATALHKILG